MTYPPVIQFKTRAYEAEARARLARERRAVRPPRRRLVNWLALLPRGTRRPRHDPNLRPTGCEQ